MSVSSYWPREPWAVHIGDVANEGRTFVKSEDNCGYKRWVAETSHAVDPYGKRCDEATARRISAAINAVAGIPTEALEAGALAALVVAAPAGDGYVELCHNCQRWAYFAGGFIRLLADDLTNMARFPRRT